MSRDASWAQVAVETAKALAMGKASAEAERDNAGPSFAYSLPVHSFHTRRDRVASLTT